MSTPDDRGLRFAAGLTALVSVPFVLFGVAWTGSLYALGSERADVAFMWFLAFATGTVAALGLGLGIYAVEDRAPRWRRLALVPVNAVVIVAMLTEPWWTG